MAYTAFSVSQNEVPDAAKWNTLGANDAHFYTFLGMDLAWTSWTPTWTGITKGGATVTAYYTQVGKTVFCRVRFIFGSGTVMTSTPVFTLPVTAATIYGTIQNVLGVCYIEDLATAAYWGNVRNTSTTTGGIYPNETVSFSYVANGAISTTVPMTWATGDYLETNFFYEAA